jgi:hypothetical protein
MRQVLDEGHRFNIHKFIRNALTWSSSSSYFFDFSSSDGFWGCFSAITTQLFYRQNKSFFFPDSSSYRRHGFTSASFMEWAWQT